MKKFIIGLIAAIIVLSAGAAGYGYYEYAKVNWDSAPAAEIPFMDTTLTPTLSEWNEPILFGLVYKRLEKSDDGAALSLGLLGRAPAHLSAQLPEGFSCRSILTRNGETVMDETQDGGDAGFEAEAGDYALEITADIPEVRGNGYGRFVYRCSFFIEEAEPELLTGTLELAQGDIVSLKLINVPPDVTPSAETALGMAVFTPGGSGVWHAAIPVGNAQKPGSYAIGVSVGETRFEIEAAVLRFDFVEQNLIIDTGNPVISEASSPAAYREYREKIPPLFETFDTERYWEGVFDRPAEGRISTEFGTIRYTNGDYSSSRSHNGMDIAAPEGTPVYAPNAGRVVFAERLLNTGNTIVIEHGGGLKSYYFHLSRIDAVPGDMLGKGELIGAIGTTGYSTGPHLHYEMRIGDKPVSPSMLFSESAGLYSLGAEND
jgi:murein DD-endopeptidase MepM/ murein hydrolase activator NlpD